MQTQFPVSGAGLGFRRELIPQMKNADLRAIDFFEASPENWLNSSGQTGGAYGKNMRYFSERFPFVCHGLSLSIGSSAELDFNLLKNVKAFMDAHAIELYTEHLSWCSDEKGHLYDLLPIPCTEEAVKWVARRIRQAQDFMGRRIGFENASYYYVPPLSEMSDAEFISAVCETADCLLHLDINNIYVNSKNFGFDAHDYLRQLPIERTCYMHVAHGAEVIDDVWDLLADAYQLIYQRTGKLPGDIPTCVERDFNFPPLQSLIDEVEQVRHIQEVEQVRHIQTAQGQRLVAEAGNT